MARLLFLLIAIALVLLILKRVVGMQRLRTSTDDRTSGPAKSRFEKTQRCVRCGAFIPSSLGQSTDAGYICRQGCQSEDPDDARRP